MTKYVAFLRGINIGGNNKVEMAKLKLVFESLGFTHVSTYLNSGNVVFSATSKSIKNISKKIEESILKNFQIAIRVLVKDAESIMYICNQVPSKWKEEVGTDTHVAFLFEEIESGCIPKIDGIIHIEGALLCLVNTHEWSKDVVYKYLNTTIGKQVTVRTLRTVERVRGMLGG